MKTRDGVRLIALLEAAKGLLVTVAGFGLLLLVHRDAQGYAETLVRHLHLNPARHTPQIFLEVMARATDARLQLLALGAAAYAAVRLAEAYGLWRGRRWAEWLGAASGAIYVPFELYEIAAHGGALPVVALAVNVLVVAYLLHVLRVREGGHSGAPPGSPGARPPGDA